jgi:hypothetical protein
VFDSIPLFRTPGAAPGREVVDGGCRRPTAWTNSVAIFARWWPRSSPGDTRKLSDFRRSGAKEAELGGVTASALGRKMANTIETDPKLRETYLPTMQQDASLVRLADHARKHGRDKLRNAGKSKS